MTTPSTSASTAQANARDDAAQTALKSLTDTAHWTEVDDILKQLDTSKQEGLSDADAQTRLDE